MPKSCVGGMAERMGPVSERKAHVPFLSECRFQNENSMVVSNIRHADGHEPRGVQGNASLKLSPREV